MLANALAQDNIPLPDNILLPEHTAAGIFVLATAVAGKSRTHERACGSLSHHCKILLHQGMP
jgi:hypothetical protein